MHRDNGRDGFTIIEFIVATSLMVVVMGLAIVTLNPSGQLATARNNQRNAHLNVLINAIRTNVTENRTGKFVCPAGDIPTSSKRMAVSGANTFNIAPCIVPAYIFALPFDPSGTSTRYASNEDYDTGYFVIKNATTGQITVSAPSAELTKVISVTR